MPFSQQVKEQIFKDARGKCDKCGKTLTSQNRRAHHIHHEASGGHNGASNGRALCITCHNSLHK